ncbi:MAG: GNAT family N-acetyltransferase [Clostridiales bacterium]|nr:GNAT family N-acetyltransferase [Clostridiales bacterium]
MLFEVLMPNNEQEIKQMSEMATDILRDYYDPIIGKEQNDYMLNMFQSVASIRDQLAHGYHYYFVRDDDGKNLGFFAFYPRGNALYLSKFYLYKDQRGKGYARSILEFLKAQAKELDLGRIELNVNRNNDTRFIYEKLGFTVAWEEKNDIGNGFYMDDYVYALGF